MKYSTLFRASHVVYVSPDENDLVAVPQKRWSAATSDWGASQVKTEFSSIVRACGYDIGVKTWSTELIVDEVEESSFQAKNLCAMLRLLERLINGISLPSSAMSIAQLRLPGACRWFSSFKFHAQGTQKRDGFSCYIHLPIARRPKYNSFLVLISWRYTSVIPSQHFFGSVSRRHGSRLRP